MLRVTLDSNIWNKLANDTDACNRIQLMCKEDSLRVVIPDTLLRELQHSPWGGVPAWFPIEDASDSVFVVGHSRVGRARVGDGTTTYSKHKGTSRKVADAILADFTSRDADLFVTEDHRARRRYNKLTTRGEAISYADFARDVLGL